MPDRPVSGFTAGGGFGFGLAVGVGAGVGDGVAVAAGGGGSSEQATSAAPASSTSATALTRGRTRTFVALRSAAGREPYRWAATARSITFACGLDGRPPGVRRVVTRTRAKVIATACERALRATTGAVGTIGGRAGSRAGGPGRTLSAAGRGAGARRPAHRRDRVVDLEER